MMMELSDMDKQFRPPFMEMTAQEACRQRFGAAYHVASLCGKLERMNRNLMSCVDSPRNGLPEFEVAVWMAVYLSDVASGLVKETRRLVESLRAQSNADSTASSSD